MRAIVGKMFSRIKKYILHKAKPIIRFKSLYDVVSLTLYKVFMTLWIDVINYITEYTEYMDYMNGLHNDFCDLDLNITDTCINLYLGDNIQSKQRFSQINHQDLSDSKLVLKNTGKASCSNQQEENENKNDLFHPFSKVAFYPWRAPENNYFFERGFKRYIKPTATYLSNETSSKCLTSQAANPNCKSTVVKESNGDSEETLSSKSWECDICFALNFGSTSRCYLCDSLRLSRFTVRPDRVHTNQKCDNLHLF
ncbi:uncharacterized protein LOC111637602 [Centruroides sculpturatus]|uniref:uncharacterized protein LOC111637602 n=1 Tax=Centruroides sculpturatus TaxID=218467 RepID=UPI000C6EDF77|nr:uncharacterized protein LOC111637602 [Centruroides sculpturatus]